MDFNVNGKANYYDSNFLLINWRSLVVSSCNNALYPSGDEVVNAVEHACACFDSEETFLTP
jgi:hypothetical protein